MLKIFQMEPDKHHQQVRQLFHEYLVWANGMLNREFHINFDIETMIAQNMVELDKFAPPHGRLLLGTDETDLVGCACLHRIGEDTGEVKRMYVRPEQRRRGAGRALLSALIVEARQIGYARLRLDSARFMHPAQTLYRSAGFQPIAPYAESEIPEQYRPHWVFMELGLQP
jgi:GNAT superfamily N-acetyltransferase